VNPDHARLLKKARDFDRSGKVAEAATAYREFLNRVPGHAAAWADYAGKLLLLHRLEEAEQACETALKIEPRNLSAPINLGFILMQRGQLNESEYQFQRALTADPRRMDAQLGLAECLIKKGDLESVRKILQGVTRKRSGIRQDSEMRTPHAEMWAIFGGALLERQKVEEAGKAFETALQIDPSNLAAKANQGCILMEQARLDEAEERFRGLLAKNPRREDIRLLLITCLAKKGDLDTAEQEIAKVIQQEPGSSMVHRSLIGTYYSLGLWTDFRSEIERFRQFNPTSPDLEYEQSHLDLLLGEMPLGWERYEARLRVPGRLGSERHFSQPAWSGEPFAGRTLLIWAEQGLGDTLMFARYLPRVKALGGRVILETQSALTDVMATGRGADEIIPRGEPLPPFDLQASLLSLPWIFRTDLSSIPAEIPYLDVPEKVPHQETISRFLALAVAHGKTKVGLVWAGSPSHKRDRERSLPVTALTPLAALPEVAWFSLQIGRTDTPPLPHLISLAPFLSNFSDTAYALSGMDLVITVDTSVAHLAGAMGIPALVLLTYQPDFRWMLDRDDSPWYPTLRLYRQPAFGDWESVIRRLVSDLTQDS